MLSISESTISRQVSRLRREEKGPAKGGPGAKDAVQGSYEGRRCPAPGRGPKARAQQEEADRLRAEAEALRDRARLEDVSIWVMEKVKRTKKSSRTCYYLDGHLGEGSPTRNVHLGSCARMDADAALQKAKAIKAEAPGMKV